MCGLTVLVGGARRQRLGSSSIPVWALSAFGQLSARAHRLRPSPRPSLAQPSACLLARRTASPALASRPSPKLSLPPPPRSWPTTTPTAAQTAKVRPRSLALSSISLARSGAMSSTSADPPPPPFTGRIAYTEDRPFDTYGTGGQGYTGATDGAGGYGYGDDDKLPPAPPRNTGSLGRWRKQDRGKVLLRVRASLLLPRTCCLLHWSWDGRRLERPDGRRSRRL